MDLSLEKRFKILCGIARATHFQWRRAVLESCTDINPTDIVLKFWEECGHDTAEAYLRILTKYKMTGKSRILVDVAKLIVNSSESMGEKVSIESKSQNEVLLRWSLCPWYEWHKRYNVLEEDQLGCDKWLETIINDLNKNLGTRIKFETITSLPGNGKYCLRRLWVERD